MNSFWPIKQKHDPGKHLDSSACLVGISILGQLHELPLLLYPGKRYLKMIPVENNSTSVSFLPLCHPPLFSLYDWNFFAMKSSRAAVLFHALHSSMVRYEVCSFNIHPSVLSLMCQDDFTYSGSSSHDKNLARLSTVMSDEKKHNSRKGSSLLNSWLLYLFFFFAFTSAPEWPGRNYGH